MARVLDDPGLYTIDEDREEQHRSPPGAYYAFLSKPFFHRHGRLLLGCALAWLIVDIPFYSSTLFQSKIYQPWFPQPEEVNVYQEAFNVAKFQAILAITSTIPGYWAAVYFIDRVGRRKIQMMGFFFMAVFLFSLAGPYDSYWHHHSKWGFIILYGFTFFFSNFGPNTTTFIVPAELFPARFRSACHGIAGAAGKVGAIIGAVGFLWASQDRQRDAVEEGWKPGIGMMYALLILGGVCLVGMAVTSVLTLQQNWPLSTDVWLTDRNLWPKINQSTDFL